MTRRRDEAVASGEQFAETYPNDIKIEIWDFLQKMARTIILTHAHADFDALASVCAARRLNPDGQIYLSGKPEPEVFRFLQEHGQGLVAQFGIKAGEAMRSEQLAQLFEDAPDAPDATSTSVAPGTSDAPDATSTFVAPGTSDAPDAPNSTEIILAGVSDVSLLGCFAEYAPGRVVKTYDHRRSDGTSDCGACITYMLKMLREKNLPIDPKEASLYLLGIYEETGSLSYPGTTTEDLRAAAWLLEQGTPLSLVSIYARNKLSLEQRVLRQKLLKAPIMQDISGFRVFISSTELPAYSEAFEDAAGTLMELFRPDVLVCAAIVPERIHIFVLASTVYASAQSIMADFGGTGQPACARASIKPRPWPELVEDITESIAASLPPLVKAADIMSTPVDCIDIDDGLTVEQAGEYLRKIGHSAACVSENGKIVGLIARSDIDKALFHGLGQALVKAYMIRTVMTVEPGAPLAEVCRVLVENDVGRVPVTENGKLLGIISRSDILRSINANAPSQIIANDTPQEILRLNPGQLALLKRCGEAGAERGFEVYVVGGFVRDMLMGIENHDIDLVVEDDGIGFAKYLAERLGGTATAHKQFATAVVELSDGMKIDVVTARTELYDKPAALPRVRPSTLKQDLYRRDFSINAMAMRLNPQAFGQIVDHFGGRRDLRGRIIRVLHNLSFVDDPTRIFRAVRFEQRYGFKMDANTEHLAADGLETGLLNLLSGQRIGHELELILSESDPFPAIVRMENIGMLARIDPNIDLGCGVRGALERLQALLAEHSGLIETGALIPRLVYLNGLLANMQAAQAERFMDRLGVKSKDKQRLYLPGPMKMAEFLEALEKAAEQKGILADMLREISLEGLLWLEALTGSEKLADGIASFIRVLRFVESPLNGKEIIALGYQRGPQIAEMLRFLRRKAVDGEIATADDAKALLEHYSPPVK
ncbi:MAG: CBS domain-containing protein [bacterium]|nr:CBS domain-containing protein [bacterium]